MDVNWLFGDNFKATFPELRQEGLPRLKAGDVLTASVLSVEKGNDALIAMGPIKAYARLPQPVAAGEQIQLRVMEGETGPRMVMLTGSDVQTPGRGLAGDAMAIRRLEPFTDAAALQRWSRTLVSGQTIEGRITGFEKDGLQLVDFGKFNAFARIDIPVREGQVIPLSVVKGDRGIEFSVLTASPTSTTSRPSAATMTDGSVSPPDAGDLAVIRDQVGAMLDGSLATDKALPQTLRASMVHLQQLLAPLAVRGDPAELMARIREFVENSGVYFEKRLESVMHSLASVDTAPDAAELARYPAIRELIDRDLKPNLLRLNHFLDQSLPEMPDKDRPVLETMRNLIGRTLAHIEHQQQAATEKPASPDLFMAFSHLLLLADPNRRARLNVFYARKERDGQEKPPRVSLLLEMDRLGSVRTDLWMVNRDLNVTFFVRDTDVKNAIDTARDQITGALNETFNTVAVSVVVSEKKIDQFDEASLATSDQRQVDLNI